MVIADARTYLQPYVRSQGMRWFRNTSRDALSKRWRAFVLAAVFVAYFSGVFNPCKVNTPAEEYRTDHDTMKERSKSVVSQELASDEDYADAFRLMLTGLSNMCFQRSSADFRRIISREKVGLLWSLHPEKYWEDHVLPELQEEVTIIDVGANVGQFAIPNAEAGHNVLSFEPNPDTCKLLQSIATKKKLRRKVSLVELFHLND